MPFTILNPEAPSVWLREQCAEVAAKDLVVLALERAVTRDVQFLMPDMGLLKTPPDPDAVPIGHHFVPSWASMEKLDQVRHVIDWLVAAVRAEEPWLKRTDREGRPVKLTKIGSLDRAAKEADKAMRRMGSAMAAVADDRRGETTWRDLADGWRLVRLGTVESLDSESARMQHCIGQGAYDDALASGARLFLSLRDPSGKPHATLDVDARGHVLLQVQGKQNRPPEPRYVRLLLPYLKELHGDIGQIGRLDLIRGIDGEIHQLSELPDDLEIETRLTVDMAMTAFRMPKDRFVARSDLTIVSPPGTTVVMPRVLTVRGELRLQGDFAFPDGAEFRAARVKFAEGSVAMLPDGTTVDGQFDIRGTKIGSLPRGLRAEHLVLHEADLVDYPSDAVVRSLSIKGTDIVRLPDGLSLYSLVLDGTRIERLPDDLEIKQNLHVMHSKLVSLGSGTRIGNDLHLVDNQGLVSLPEDLRVDAVLSIHDCPVAKIPSGTGVKSFELVGVPGGILPEAIDIEGSLKITTPDVLTMPVIIRVGSSLSIECVGPLALPPGTAVGDRASLAAIRGAISIGDGSRLGRTTTIGTCTGLKIGGDVDMARYVVFSGIHGRTTLPRLPASTLSMRLENCSDVRIVGNFGTKSIVFIDSQRIVLPRRFVVRDYLHVSDTSFASLPENMRVGGRLVWKNHAGPEDVTLPPGLKVVGSAVFQTGFSVFKLGKGSVFGDDLDLDLGNVELAEGLVVARTLSGRGISHLPAGCRIGSFTGSTHLRTVGANSRFGNLDLGASGIAHLPSGLVVTGDLNIGATDVEELPDDILVGGEIVLPEAFVGCELPDGIDPDKVYQEGLRGGRSRSEAVEATEDGSETPGYVGGRIIVDRTRGIR